MKNPLSVFNNRSNVSRESLSADSVVAQMENEMRNWLRQSPLWSQELTDYDYLPSCNYKETDKEYILSFDVPGIRRDDITIEVENNRLTVYGERKGEKKQEDLKSHYVESYFGSFSRSFTFPNSINEDKVDAHAEDGVLTITVPKLESSKSKKVKIH